MRRLLFGIFFLHSFTAVAETPAFYRQVSQIIWVVKDINPVLQHWAQLGFSGIQDLGTISLQDWYRGREQSVTVHAVTGYLGDLSIEMVQPETGVCSFSEFLSKHGNGIFAIVHQVESQEMQDREVGRLKRAGVSHLEKIKMPNGASYTFFDTEPRGKYVLALVQGPNLRLPKGSPGVISHIAPVIRSAKPVSDFWVSIGLPPLEVDHATPREDSRYRGQPLLLSFDVGWQRQTQFTYEWIIPPQQPPNIYADFLARHGEGIQHLGMPVDDLNAAIEQYKKLGYSVWQSGAWGDVGKPHSGQYAYMDTDAIGGVVVELIHSYH
jgi:hypothetical protein